MTHLGIEQFNNLEFQKQKLLSFINEQNDNIKNMLTSALAICQKAHQSQKRDEGVSYAIHPIRTANILFSELGQTEPELIAAALLHDVIEDSGLSLNDVKNKFGSQTARLVSNLTRERPENETEEQKKINKKEKFIKLMEADQATRLAKCADLLDNARSWPLIPETSPSIKKFPRWLNETITFAIPMAKATDVRLVSKVEQAIKLVKLTHKIELA